MSASPASDQPYREVLAGIVERVTFHNVETGFCVLRVKARGHRDLTTIVGHAATICAGEWITASGDWVNDRTHGQQFKARFLRTSAPSSVEGIERYLASGMIRGIGPVYARKMVRAFGEKVFDIIEAEPDCRYGQNQPKSAAGVRSGSRERRHCPYPFRPIRYPASTGRDRLPDRIIRDDQRAPITDGTRNQSLPR